MFVKINSRFEKLFAKTSFFFANRRVFNMLKYFKEFMQTRSDALRRRLFLP